MGTRTGKQVTGPGSYSLYRHRGRDKETEEDADRQN